MEQIRLNLIPTGPMPICHASQYDKKREIGLVLFNGTRPLILTDETLELDVRKSDSHIVTIDVPTPEGTNLAVFETTEQMCAVAGSNECELRIKKAGADIGSLNFIMEIERSPMENGLQSDSEIRNLATQIAEVATPVVEEIAPPIIRDFLDDEYYTAEETDEAIETATEGKADTTYVNTELDKKADKDTTYNKTQVDNALNNKMDKNNPTGMGSFAVGRNVTAFGNYAHAEGEGSTASGAVSHAEGQYSIASGWASHAEGQNTTASGRYSHSQGFRTIANHQSQTALGEYNVADTSTASATTRGNYVEIVGNGTSDSSRSNARTLDWQGNETIAGDLTFNGSTSLTDEISRLDDKIDDLPEPMIYKGTLGTGGTIQTLPAADAAHEGYTYKVITAGTYAGKEAKIGDTFTCCKPEGAQDFTWDYFSRGDTDTDTWRNIKVNGTEVIGSGISSGAVDFIGSENIEIEYESTGNKIKAKTKNLYTKEEVDDLIEEAIYDILPSDTESGPIANFETDLALPIKSLEVDVNAVQDLHGYSKPWIGGTGSNKWDEQWELGYYNVNTGAATPSTNQIRCKNRISVEPSTNYYIKVPSSIWILEFDANDDYLNVYASKRDAVLTTSANTHYIRFYTLNSYGNTYNNDIAINYPSTETTYSPYENICPITGFSQANVVRCGKNIAPKIHGGTKSSVTCEVYEDGTLKFTMATPPTFNAAFYSDYFLLKAGRYKLNGVPAGGSGNYVLYLDGVSGSANTGTDKDVTVANDVTTRLVAQVYSGGNANNIVFSPMLRLMGNDASYTTYHGNTYLIPFGDTYYGCKIDVIRGKGKVTHIAFDDWANKNVKLYGINTHGIANFYIDHPSQLTKPNVGICNLLTRQTSLYSETTNEGFYVHPTTQYIRVLSTRASTVAEFKTWATNNNLMIINELQTPIEVQLTPQEIEAIVGTNNILADTGDCAVEFKESINQKIASLQALLLNT